MWKAQGDALRPITPALDAVETNCWLACQFEEEQGKIRALKAQRQFQGVRPTGRVDGADVSLPTCGSESAATVHG
jgi:hypothetical protein